MLKKSFRDFFSYERSGDLYESQEDKDFIANDCERMKQLEIEGWKAYKPTNLSISCPPTEVLTPRDTTEEGSGSRTEQRYDNDISVRKNDSFSTIQSSSSIAFPRKPEDRFSSFSTTPSAKSQKLAPPLSLTRRVAFSILSSSRGVRKHENKKSEDSTESAMSEVVDGETYHEARRRHRISFSCSTLADDLAIKSTRSVPTKASADTTPDNEDELNLVQRTAVRRVSSFTGENRRLWGYDASRSLQQNDIHKAARMERLQEVRNKAKQQNGMANGASSRVLGNYGSFVRARYESDVCNSTSKASGLTSPSLDLSAKSRSVPSTPQVDSLLPAKWIGRYELKTDHVRNRRSLNSLKVLLKPHSSAPSPISNSSGHKRIFHGHDEQVHVISSPSLVRSKIMAHPPHKKSVSVQFGRTDKNTETEPQVKRILSFSYAQYYCENTSKYKFLGEWSIEGLVHIRVESIRSRSGSIRDDGLLGFGFSSLLKAKDRETGVVYMAKVFDKTLLDEADAETQNKAMESLQLEREILEGIRNPFLLSCIASMQDDRSLYIVLDFSDGESLAICLEREGRLSEAAAVFLIAEVVEALSHLHDHSIVHRAVSPISILIDGDGHMRLTDFSAAKGNVTDSLTGCMTICGIDPYSAPEIQFGLTGHGLAVDWWAIGVLIYEILTGRVPVSTVMLPTLESDIETSLDMMPGHISTCTKDILKRLLEVDPECRLGSNSSGSQEVKGHSYFGHVEWAVLKEKGYISPFCPSQYFPDVEEPTNTATSVKDRIQAYSKLKN